MVLPQAVGIGIHLFFPGYLVRVPIRAIISQPNVCVQSTIMRTRLPFLIALLGFLGSFTGCGDESPRSGSNPTGAENSVADEPFILSPDATHPSPAFGINCSDDLDCQTIDSSVCRIAWCDPEAKKCARRSAENGIPCDDGSRCTSEDQCLSGQCKGIPVMCPEEEPCVHWVCESDMGCVSVEKEGSCHDGNPCISDAQCEGGECTPLPVLCDDGESLYIRPVQSGNGHLHLPPERIELQRWELVHGG